MKTRTEQEIELLRTLIPEAARVLREPERKTWLPDFLARGPRALARTIGSGRLRPFSNALADLLLKQLGVG